jgi:hypothetical protein
MNGQEQFEKWKASFFLLHSLWETQESSRDPRWGILLNNLSDLLRNDPKIQFSSSHKTTLEHPAFQLLLEIGPVIVPWVFKRYSKNDVGERLHGWWCPMFLGKMFKQNNVILSEHAGNYNLMREDWLKWGREQGYLGNE